jgi:ketosteroid isomerase-like protein
VARYSAGDVAGERRNRPPLDGSRQCATAPEDLLAPEFTIENVSTAVTDRTYRGPEGFRQWIGDFFDVLDADARFKAEPVATGDDYVVGKLSIVGRGSVSGAPVDLRYYGVMWIRDGRITRAVGYSTRREALAAVGLSE